MQRYGHLKVRHVLRKCEWGEGLRDSAVCVQCSSLGSLDDKWLVQEFGRSVGEGTRQLA